MFVLLIRYRPRIAGYQIGHQFAEGDRRPRWVKMRKSHGEHFSTAVPQKADVVLNAANGSFVPGADIASSIDLGHLRTNCWHPSQKASTNQLGDVDIHLAVLSDRLNSARKILILHQVLIRHPANSRSGRL
jgi:hypothetical protein